MPGCDGFDELTAAACVTKKQLRKRINEEDMIKTINEGGREFPLEGLRLLEELHKNISLHESRLNTNITKLTIPRKKPHGADNKRGRKIIYREEEVKGR